MIRALYTAASGMVAQSTKQDIIANNIANAQTAGFKGLRTTTSSFKETIKEQVGFLAGSGDKSYPKDVSSGSRVDIAQRLDESPGPLQPTGNNLDFAIEGPGEFEVVSASGKRLTRAGNFRLGADDELVTADGSKVQGRSGAIRLPKSEFEVKSDGTIVVDGAEIDQIRISGSKTNETRVVQGSLEGANVSALSEMVQMISNMRSFEANQKVIQSVDSTLDKLINEAGKV